MSEPKYTRESCSDDFVLNKVVNSLFCFHFKMSSGTCTDKITVSDFNMWSEISLKRYLSVRKKNVDGDFETLVYR